MEGKYRGECVFTFAPMSLKPRCAIGCRRRRFGCDHWILKDQNAPDASAFVSMVDEYQFELIFLQAIGWDHECGHIYAGQEVRRLCEVYMLTNLITVLVVAQV